MKDNNDEIAKLYNKLIVQIKSYHPSSDFRMVRKAYEVAKEAHKNQFAECCIDSGGVEAGQRNNHSGYSA